LLRRVRDWAAQFCHCDTDLQNSLYVNDISLSITLQLA
jgi:hypothetical protein